LFCNFRDSNCVAISFFQHSYFHKHPGDKRVYRLVQS